ncbi:MAG: dihydroorotate dehydrogenase [Rhodobacteraceae bacterium]|nr:dihydroorotate dehydrogenase [Paracoccaceae bacterium]
MADRKFAPQDLDVLFAQACSEVPDLPPGLLARVLADADAELAARSRAAPAPRPVLRLGIMAELLALLGGWRAVSGLATATVAGVWIGFSGLSGLPDAATALFGMAATETLASVNLLPGDDVFALAMGLEAVE